MKSKTVKNLRKLTLFATAMALLGVSATAADLPEKRLNGIKRDIKVMSNIFKTTISERLGHEVGHLKGMYLAKQGMLFSMNLHQPFNFSFGEHFAPVVSTPSGLVYPVTTEEGLEAIEESTMQVVESALEMAENQLEVYSDFNWSTL